MFNKENEFNNEEIKDENVIRPDGDENPRNQEENLNKPEENAVNYSAANGTKEYIYAPRADESSANRENTINRENSVGENSAYRENAYSSTNNTNSYSSFTSAYNTETTTKRRKPKRRIFSTVALLLVVSLLSGFAGSYMTMYLYKNGAIVQNNTNNVNNNAQSIKINLNDETYYAAAVNEKNKDSVVGITTTVRALYETFWGAQERESESIGSGIIVDPNGLILTNSHVIGDGSAKKIVVSLTDGTTEEGTVLWFDTTLDLAVVKINRVGLIAAELGDSDSLIVGEPVVAIGNPMSLSLNGTLTNGVISGLNRSITINGTTIKPLIQTNASINPGNSGGPLFNAKGQVIGVNTAKMSSAEGLGFSIPINVVIPILEQITKGEAVSSLYVGIQGLSVADYKERLNINLSIENGVFIVEVIKDGPADKAGLMYGDIITAIDKTEIKEMSDLKRALYNYREGDKVQIKYLRNGSEYTAELTLMKKPKNF